MPSPPAAQGHGGSGALRQAVFPGNRANLVGDSVTALHAETLGPLPCHLNKSLRLLFPITPLPGSPSPHLAAILALPGALWKTSNLGTRLCLSRDQDGSSRGKCQVLQGQEAQPGVSSEDPQARGRAFQSCQET